MAIFVSYAHEDSKTVNAIVAYLEGLGFSMWVDRSIQTGEGFAERIVDAIVGSDAFLLFLSPASRGSRAVLQEIQVGAKCRWRRGRSAPGR